MNEYIMPVKYQNVGYGISVKIAGLESNREKYKQMSLSIDNKNWINTKLNENNLDISDIVTFDNLSENKYYIIYVQIITNDDNIINLSAKIVTQTQFVTVEPPYEVKRKYYLGGGLIKE